MSPRIISANLVVKLMSFYREKSAMFFTIAFPIILILVFGTIFMDQENVSFTTRFAPMMRGFILAPFRAYPPGAPRR